MRLLLLGSVIFVGSCSGQVQFNAWNVPYSSSNNTVSGVTTSCPNGSTGGPFYADFTSATFLAHLNAVVIPIDAACIDRTTNSSPYTLNPAWGSTGGFDATVGLYTAAGVNEVDFVVRYIQNPGSSSGNTFTPAYVFSQDWANQIAPAWSAYASFYANGFLGAIISGTEYYFQTSTNCVTGPTVTEPAWAVGGGPYTDGSCMWSYVGTNAPPQDVVFCPGYTYTGAPGTGNYNISPPGTLTAAVLASGLPAIWEQPFAAWVQRLAAEIINHLKFTAPYRTQIAYVRFGVSQGGEASTNCATQLESLFPSGLNTDAQLKTVWTGFAASSYAYNANQRTTASFAPYLMAAVNCGTGLSSGQDCSWADIEATAAASQPGYAVGSQGLQTGDLASLSGGTACSNDWCNWHNAVWGRVPIVELQECNVSDAAFNGMGSPAGCITNSNSPSAALPQVLVLAVQHNTDDIELYANEYLCAWDQANFIAGTGGPKGLGCSLDVSSAYQAAITQTETGQPSGTGNLFGKAVVLGGSATVIF
jgi:hypothetical protein